MRVRTKVRRSAAWSGKLENGRLRVMADTLAWPAKRVVVRGALLDAQNPRIPSDGKPLRAHPSVTAGWIIVKDVDKVICRAF